jgi:hypothetical protein
MKKILVLFLFVIFLCPQGAFAKKKEAIAIPDGSGYVGTLPDLESKFKKTQEEESQAPYDYEDGFDDKTDIKPAPRNNPAFVNIIMKKDKTSQYINDLNEIITILEQLQTTVEGDDNLQLFSAKSNFLGENVVYFRNKYKNRAEGSYISFKKVMQINTHVQSIAQLRREKEVYSPYVTSDGNGNEFSQNNIDVQMDYLLDDIKSSLVVLKEAK